MLIPAVTAAAACSPSGSKKMSRRSFTLVLPAATAAAVTAAGGETEAVEADVSRADDCARMVEAAQRRWGHLDVLFNNAGISHIDDGDAVQTDEDVWDLTMAVNLKGVFLGCKFGIPALQRSGGGSIINTASFVAVMGAATS